PHLIRFIFGPHGFADAYLAEHVWEHLTLQDAHRAAANCFASLREGGRLRLAVPNPRPGPGSSDAIPFQQEMKRKPNNNQGAGVNDGEGYLVESAGSDGGHEGEGIEAQQFGGVVFPSWLSKDALAGDIHDGHLVQYTPELLANVCWSAGFVPVPVEGGNWEGGKGNTGRCGGRVDGEDERGSTTLPLETEVVNDNTLLSWDDKERDGGQSSDARLWGMVKRSLAGGDPRGEVSIVMDCIKPGGSSSSHRVETNANDGWIGSTILKHTQALLAVDSYESQDISEGTSGNCEGKCGTGRILSQCSGGADRGTDGKADKELTPPTLVEQLQSLRDQLTLERGIGRMDTPPGSEASQEMRTEAGEGTIGVEGKDYSKQQIRERSTPEEIEANLTALRSRSREALLQGDVISSLAVAESILTTSPFDPVTLLYKGVAQGHGGDWTGAWDCMEHVLALAAGRGGRVTAYHDVGASTGGSGSRGGCQRRNTGSGLEGRHNVPLDIFLAATRNMASFARAKSSTSMDSQAEILLLMEGLREVVNSAWNAPSPRSAANTATFGTENKGEHDYPRERRRSFHNSVPCVGKVQEQSDGAGKGMGMELKADPAVEAHVAGFGLSADAVEESLADLMVQIAQVLEKGGQLSAALRCYQRVLLLGRHRDSRALQGIGVLSQRLHQVKMERKQLVRRIEGGDSKWGKTWGGSRVNKREGEGGRQGAGGWTCDWSIVHPKPGQAYFVGDLIPVEFDLSMLDPGLPRPGSLFAGAPGVGGSTDSILNMEDIQGTVWGSGLGVMVCSYLKGYNAANCLEKGQLKDLLPGWHELTAEVYTLPGMTPLSCVQVHGQDDIGKGEAEAGTNLMEEARKKKENPGIKQGNYEHKQENEGSDQAEGLIETCKASQSRANACSISGTISMTRSQLGKSRQAPESHPQQVDMPELPFCFITMALNAMPFITHHPPVFQEVGRILSERAHSSTAAPTTTPALPLLPPPPHTFWEWHVVEGVAAGRADRNQPYSASPIPNEYYDPVTGLSVDGTSEFLDEIRDEGLASEGGEERGHGVGKGDGGRKYSNMHLLRRCEGHAGSKRSGSETGMEGNNACLWRDKIQMLNAAIFSIKKECLLIEVDADEMWTAAQLVGIRDMFLEERKKEKVEPGAGSSGPAAQATWPEGAEENVANEQTWDVMLGNLTRNWRGGMGTARDAAIGTDLGQRQWGRECAYFDCHFFVGKDLVTDTPDGWGHSSNDEWLRAWIFEPHSTVWLQHAPPVLARYDKPRWGGWRLLVGQQDTCIGREETRRRGLVFTHFAYVLERQVGFARDFLCVGVAKR
ncbi:unnamed protein product, partial [Choristocarpus tenellus]